jgi:regulator of protease activity HflC (stomatin/prohibitin superfamily)
MTSNQDNSTRNLAIAGISIFFSLLLINAIAGPMYNVWKQSLAGKAELQKAEYTRQVAVLEAKAKLDSSKELAMAEVERAKGVAQANQIIGDSLKGNNDYLSYLWITGLEDGSKNGNKTIYMIPSQGNIPAPVFNVDR